MYVRIMYVVYAHMHVEHMCVSGYAHRVSNGRLWISFLENSLSSDYFIIISSEIGSLIEP